MQQLFSAVPWQRKLIAVNGLHYSPGEIYAFLLIPGRIHVQRSVRFSVFVMEGRARSHSTIAG
jgi:hypothetical protein